MPSRVITSPGSPVSSPPIAEGWYAELRHRRLDQPRHHPGRGQADRVGAVPGRRQVDDAELAAGVGVVHRRGPADPVVHDRRVVLGAEHHRRLGQPVGEVERVGADRLVVPAAAGHEVDGLGLAPHHPAAVRPQDAGLRVGDGEHQVAVLGGTPQLRLDALDRDLERRVAPDRRRSRPRRRAAPRGRRWRSPPPTGSSWRGSRAAPRLGPSSPDSMNDVQARSASSLRSCSSLRPMPSPSSVPQT